MTSETKSMLIGSVDADIKKRLGYAVGHQLYQARKANGMTGKKLGEYIGVSQQQISRYERGVCKIDVEMLMLILSYLDVPLDNFFTNVSLDLKEKDPKVYEQYNRLFFPMVNLNHDDYVWLKLNKEPPFI